MAATGRIQVDPVPAAGRRAHALGVLAGMEQARSRFEPRWHDIHRFIAPDRGVFRGQAHMAVDQLPEYDGSDIINSTATTSFDILSSGMMSGLSSPARPWFRLTLDDTDRAEYGPNRVWLDQVARVMRMVFNRSNLYNVLPQVYSEIAPFGTTALLQLEDDAQITRFYHFTIGSFAIGQDDRHTVDSFGRRFSYTVSQMRKRWGDANLSQTARMAIARGKLTQTREILHLIVPASDEVLPAVQGAPFVEEFWEVGSDHDRPLSRKPFWSFPVYAPRWSSTGGRLWGFGLGHRVLGDVKQLQFLEAEKEAVLELHNRPPLEAGVELRGKRISLLAGDVTFTNPAATGGASVRPIHSTDPQAFNYTAADIREIEHRIRRMTFEDLFLMLANDQRSGVTAREVEERHQEKMIVLGPVLERMNEELFDPLIDRTFEIMVRRSEPYWNGTMDGEPLLPAPPEDLAGNPLRVDYISILAQAQKSVNTASLERFGAQVAQVGSLDPRALRKVDWMQFVDELADAAAVPATVLVSDDALAEALAADAEESNQQKLLAAAPAMRDMAGALRDAGAAVPQAGSALANLQGALGNLPPGTGQ
jgi:hypothetical protein